MPWWAQPDQPGQGALVEPEEPQPLAPIVIQPEAGAERARAPHLSTGEPVGPLPWETLISRVVKGSVQVPTPQPLLARVAVRSSDLAVHPSTAQLGMMAVSTGAVARVVKTPAVAELVLLA